MGVQKIFINMAILGLLIFAIMSFIYTTETENDVAIPITNNTLINDTYGDLATNLADTEAQTQASSDTFGNITPTIAIGELDIKNVVSTTSTARRIIVGLWNILIKLPMVVLGVNPIVASIVSSILLIVLVIGVWLIWKGAGK